MAQAIRYLEVKFPYREFLIIRRQQRNLQRDNKMDISSPDFPLKWRTTLARSGKLKNTSLPVPREHDAKDRASHVSKTRRAYKPRFQSDIHKKRTRQDLRIGDSPQQNEELNFLDSGCVTENTIPEFIAHEQTYDRNTDAVTAEFMDFDQLFQASQSAWTDIGAAQLHFDFRTEILGIPRSLDPPTIWHQSAHSDSRYYLQYYIESAVPRLMPLWDSSENIFVGIVVPISMNSEILMHSIICLSSYHHWLQSPSPESNKEKPLQALRHRQRVLTLFKKTCLDPNNLEDESTLAACMLMQTFEVLYSGISGWDRWLRGAVQLIRMRDRLQQDLKASNSWIKLSKCVVAIETFAATSSKFDLSLSNEYWTIYRQFREENLRKLASGEFSRLEDIEEDKHFEKLVGCPTTIVYALGRMVMLIQEKELGNLNKANPVGRSDDEWWLEAIKLEDLLLRWKPKQEDNSHLAHLTQAFQHAALVFYFRRVRNLPYSHFSVQCHVRETFSHLLLLNQASQVEGISLWPIMVSAVEIDESQGADLMEIALGRIQAMKRQKGDELYENAERTLRLIWAKRRNARSSEERLAVEWSHVSQELSWKWCMV